MSLVTLASSQGLFVISSGLGFCEDAKLGAFLNGCHNSVHEGSSRCCRIKPQDGLRSLGLEVDVARLSEVTKILFDLLLV